MPTVVPYHNESFRIPDVLLPPGATPSIPFLAQYLQLTAHEHARRLSWGVRELQSRSLTWVMVEMRVRLLRTVHRPERVRVRTWPSSHRSRFATRDFLVFADSELVPFCAADTRWVVLDLASGRPAGLPSGLRSLLPEEGPRALADDAPRLPEVEAPWFTRAFDVRLSDLDINGHVNHVHYLEWIAEAVPDDVVREKQLTELQVVFRQSAGQGDRVSIDTEPIAGHGGAFVHRLTCPERSALLVRARSLWRECGPEGAG